MSLWWKLTVFINLREKRVTNPVHPLPVVVFFQASSAHGVFLLPLSLVKIEYAGKENAAHAISSHLTRVLTMYRNFAADNLTLLIFSRVNVAVRHQDSEWRVQRMGLKGKKKSVSFQNGSLMTFSPALVASHQSFLLMKSILIVALWAFQGYLGLPWLFLW